MWLPLNSAQLRVGDLPGALFFDSAALSASCFTDFEGALNVPKLFFSLGGLFVSDGDVEK